MATTPIQTIGIPQPPDSLLKKHFSFWDQKSVIKYALYIKVLMSNQQAYRQTSNSGELHIETTPAPNASITIKDLAGRILFQDPKPLKESATKAFPWTFPCFPIPLSQVNNLPIL